MSENFNIISSIEGRQGGCPFNLQAMKDFNNIILDCEVSDIWVVRPNFSWNRGSLWQRFDCALFNLN